MKQLVQKAVLLSLTVGSAFCAANNEAILEPKTLSKALGHTLAKNLLETPTFNFDVKSVITGMQEELEGKPSPLSDAEYEHAFDLIHQKYLEEMSAQTLEQADAFLNMNIENPGIIELIPGKLQISILEKGEGSVAISENDTPILKYTGHYLDESPVEATDGEAFPMNQAIPGLQKGMIGAKKGEKRRLFIHPDLCHSETEREPLLILDVTVVETNSNIPSA